MIFDIKEMLNKVKFAIQEFFSIKKGTIDFTAGEYEIFVHVKSKKHEEIEFFFEDFDQSTCGFLDKNVFVIQKNDNGFLLKAIVESNKLKFHWKVK